MHVFVNWLPVRELDTLGGSALAAKKVRKRVNFTIRVEYRCGDKLSMNFAPGVGVIMLV